MLTLSNKISLSRIFFVLPLVFCIMRVQHDGRYRYVCLLIMLVIGLTDVLDGYFARKRKELTNLGRYLDPFADKLVLVISCIVLSSDRIWPEPRFPNWIPAVIVCRDLLLVFGTVTLLLTTGRVNCQPIILGKAATCLQIVAVVSIFVGNHVPPSALAVIWCTTITFTLISGLFYVYRGVKQIIIS